MNEVHANIRLLTIPFVAKDSYQPSCYPQIQLSPLPRSDFLLPGQAYHDIVRFWCICDGYDIGNRWSVVFPAKPYLSFRISRRI